MSTPGNCHSHCRTSVCFDYCWWRYKASGLDPLFLKRQVEQIRRQFQGHEFWLTTSRRTPAAVTEMLEQFSWARSVYYEREPINPIPDFLNHSDCVFITADSSSMISEAVSFGSAAVEILPLSDTRIGQKKFKLLIDDLSAMGACTFLTAPVL